MAGLRSRFHHINFEDFDAEDLKLIWQGELKKRDFDCEDRVTSIIAQKLAKSSGTKGFGNARSVRVEVKNLRIAA